MQEHRVRRSADPALPLSVFYGTQNRSSSKAPIASRVAPRPLSSRSTSPRRRSVLGRSWSIAFTATPGARTGLTRHRLQDLSRWSRVHLPRGVAFHRRGCGGLASGMRDALKRCLSVKYGARPSAISSARGAAWHAACKPNAFSRGAAAWRRPRWPTLCSTTRRLEG